MNALTLGLFGAYLGAGATVAAALARQGAARSAVSTAVVAWPFLVHQLWAVEDRPEPPRGPTRDAIDRAFVRLDDAVRRGGGLPADGVVDVYALRDALHAADARLAVVDRILAEDREGLDEGPLAESLATLRARRDRAAAEINAVLGEIARLRVQLGIQALSGDTVSLRDGLRGLIARARALDEVEALQV